MIRDGKSPAAGQRIGGGVQELPGPAARHAWDPDAPHEFTAAEVFLPEDRPEFLPELRNSSMMRITDAREHPSSCSRTVRGTGARDDDSIR